MAVRERNTVWGHTELQRTGSTQSSPTSSATQLRAQDNARVGVSQRGTPCRMLSSDLSSLKRQLSCTSLKQQLRCTSLDWFTRYVIREILNSFHGELFFCLRSFPRVCSRIPDHQDLARMLKACLCYGIPRRLPASCLPCSWSTTVSHRTEGGSTLTVHFPYGYCPPNIKNKPCD